MGPIPVPLPIGVVVKKGLKMRDRTVSGIAQPSLAIATAPTTILNKETPTKLATSL
ncbi:hypothetical protein [Nostoc sp. DedQUE07]|uniref:hypothetical protein n=1 Tax=Nostoc sp. DedQUE07 TaxID=3075392 RepID=UPI002AD58309|nr:hypothetical protein [Nostoc sp. DedQUE07]MDZ8130150.1 hypothetical protein [Nostoc sp. DedQUE07]